MPNRYDDLRPAEVARLLQVSPKTVARWINEGRIAHRRTLGGVVGRGHARISQEEADRLLLAMQAAGRVTAEQPSASAPDPWP